MINSQNKNKVFLVIIAILLIANVAMLAFFLQKKEPAKQNRRPDRKTMITNFLKNEIGFNQQQLIQYDTLSKQHREKIGPLFENVRNTKDDLFKQVVAADFSDSSINQAASQSAALQKMIELQTYNHIKRIRSLCTPAQQPKFDTLWVKVFNKKGDGKKK
ncbi:MAG: hypothetical protein ABIN01_04045 [Ferruginibacter sp.]